MLAKRTYKNQITIPKEALKGFEEIEYFDVVARGEEIVLRPVVIQSQGERLKRIRAKIQSLGLTEKDIDEAIRWARRPSS
ncbi:MAG: AbrB/MazE/SpoVT family DNA-binding domain-containing protein [Deltaproteobacteria bacterium]|nr:AbrB/MazE/SpoVT family DNA-binding domain-containing protein [Deltaproteobacteria bacterium]MBI4373852.1 AbrB/MazE/SpoVT family DNA-binding domain-containing protein [Deltaproteobacteria bacterium]